MKIEYITGNLLENGEKIICHSCNVAGGFGSGVAGAIAKKHPIVQKEYFKAFQEKTLYLGHVLWVRDKEILFGNMMCQPTFGNDGRKHVSYDAVDFALKALNDSPPVIDALNILQTPRIAFPLFGSALGGGSWKVIAALLEENSKKYQPIVYVLDGKIPE